jgi:hypothetical protein
VHGVVEGSVRVGGRGAAGARDGGEVVLVVDAAGGDLGNRGHGGETVGEDARRRRRLRVAEDERLASVPIEDIW